VSKQRRLHWSAPERSATRHPYRDTAIVYGAFAVIVVVVAWLSGSGLARGLIVAAVFYAAAVGWSFYRLRRRSRGVRGSLPGNRVQP
jgi:Flp pilus assembly protein TadB